MSRSSQNVEPVILWISMLPSAAERGEEAASAPDGASGQQVTPAASVAPTTRSARRRGVFISYNVLEVLAILVGGGAAGMVIVLRWPQAGAMLGTVCAVIGAGLAVLDIMKRRNGNAGSDRDQG